MAVAANADDYTNGRLNIFFTGFPAQFTGQCVSLVKWFLQDMTSVPNPQSARGHAKDFGDSLVNQGHATVVQTPQRGDIVVWKNMGGGYGHIAVVLSGNRVFEENIHVVGVSSEVVDGTTVYASRIGALNESWRAGPATFYRVKTYSEGGDMSTIIQNTDAWRSRCNKTHWLIRGRELGKTFNNYVNKEFLSFVEDCSDDPEAVAVQRWQDVGKVAIRDNWEGQIHELEAKLAQAGGNFTPVNETLFRKA